jgi:hypothetical protein
MINKGTKKNKKKKKMTNDNNVYIGTFRGNFRNGKGKMKYSNGDEYDGDWYNHSKYGFGIMKYNNGDVYEGEWKNDKRNGAGILTYNAGGGKEMKYEGNWDGDMFDFGKMTYSNGDVYEGRWVFDERSGRGVMTYSDGSLYEGQWLGDKREGEGKMIYATGDVYEGRWDVNCRHGFGKMTYTNGEVYEGRWDVDCRHGFGKMTYTNGEVYEGRWDVDCRHGFGKMTYTNGDVYEGRWVHDKQKDYFLRSANLKKMKSILKISVDEMANDLIEGEINIKSFLDENPDDNLLLVLKLVNNSKYVYYTMTRSTLKQMIDTKKKKNSIVFLCKDTNETFIQITREQLVSERPYFALQTIGIFNYVRADQVKAMITSKGQVFCIEQKLNGKRAKTVVSWSKYLFPHKMIPSALSCKKGHGGDIYSVKTVDIEYVRGQELPTKPKRKINFQTKKKQ